MNDPRSQEAVDHLQRAAKEMISAARTFLDVVEDVIEDPELVTGAVGTLGDALRGLGRRPAHWAEAAARRPFEADLADDARATDDAHVTEDGGDATSAPASEGTVSEGTVSEGTGQGSAGSRPGRVRRIAVD